MTDEPQVDAPDFHPRVFISYSSEPVHDDWVRRLSERMSNGIDVVFDQWEWVSAQISATSWSKV